MLSRVSSLRMIKQQEAKVRSLVFTVLVTLAASASGWTFLADLPDGVRPGGLQSDGNGGYIVEYEETTTDGIIDREIVIDSSGNIESREAEYDSSRVPGNEDTFVTFPYPDYYETWDTFGGITRLSLSGDTLWSVTLDTVESRVEVFQPVIPCRDGGCFAVFGPTHGEFVWKFYKLSESGEVLMSGEFQMQGGPVIRLSAVKETADSGFVLCGTTDDLGMNLFMYVIGIDSDGSLLFEIKEDFRFHAAYGLIELDEGGNIYIAGSTGFERPDGWFLPPYDSDVFLMKLDPSGNEIWRTVLEYPLENRPYYVHVNDDGSVAMVIRSFSYEPTDLTSQYSLIVFQPE